MEVEKIRCSTTDTKEAGCTGVTAVAGEVEDVNGHHRFDPVKSRLRGGSNKKRWGRSGSGTSSKEEEERKQQH